MLFRSRSTFAPGKGTLSVAFAPSGLTVAVGSSDRTITVWDSRSGRKLHTLEGHNQAIHNLAYSPDGRRIASASSDQTVRIWDPVNGQLLLTIPFPEAAFNLAWSPDGRRIAVLVLDLFDIPPEEIRAVRVRQTFVGGVQRFHA